MISLKRCVEDYDTLSRARAESLGALLGVLKAAHQYVVETDPRSVEQYRSALSTIIGRLQSEVEEPETVAMQQLPVDVRASMRDYRDRAAAYIEQIRRDLTEASEGLYQVLSTIERSDSDPEERLRGQIKELNTLSRCDDLERMRQQVKEVASELNACVEALRTEKNAIIAQLQCEIQTLHRSLEQAQRAATLDKLTGLLNRDEFERLLRRDVIAHAATGVIHIWLRNFHSLVQVHPPPIIDQLLTAFAKRLKNVIPPEAVAGRWRSDVFCVMLPKALVRSVCGDVAQSCGGKYVCVDGGSAVAVHMRADTTVATRNDYDDADDVVARLDLIQHG